MNLLIILMRKRKYLVILTIILSIASVSLLLWWNFQLSEIINNINRQENISHDQVLYAVITMLLNGGIAFALSMCSSWTLETIAHDLRMSYANHFIQLPYQQIEHLSVGEQISKLQNEIDDVSSFLRMNLFALVDDLIRFLATFGWMLYLNSYLTILSSLPVLFLVWYSLFASKLIGKTAQISQQANQEMTGFSDTLLAVFPILRIFNAAALLNRQYKQKLKDWESSKIKEEQRKALLMSISGMISSFPLLLIFFIGGTQVIKGTEQIGILYIFLNLSGNVSGIMMNMAGRIAEFRRFSVNMKRLEASMITGEEYKNNEYNIT